MASLTSPVSLSTTPQAYPHTPTNGHATPVDFHRGLLSPRNDLHRDQRAPSSTMSSTSDISLSPGDTECRLNRVSLKIEVPYTDHSHIIGRAGRVIKAVMSATNCHIHFPDSNRFSATDKCNQVSIAGSPQDVENARQQVRRMMPLIFMFEIPIPLDIHRTAPAAVIQEVQQRCGVQVFIRGHGRQSCVAVVKGNSWDFGNVKRAVLCLLKTYKMDPVQVVVYVSLEISPQHHSAVLGPGRSNAKAIMAQTSTYISWPDLSDQNLPIIRRSHIMIAGGMDAIFLARDMILGCLPIILMAELPANYELDMQLVQNVMQTYDVLISTKPKPRSMNGARLLHIRGVERKLQDVFDARTALMKLNETRVQVQIPKTYELPSAPPPQIKLGHLSHVFHPLMWRLTNNNVEVPSASSYGTFRGVNFPVPHLPDTTESNPLSSLMCAAVPPLSPTQPEQALRSILTSHPQQLSMESPEKDLIDRRLEQSNGPLSPRGVVSSPVSSEFPVGLSLLRNLDLNAQQPRHVRSELELFLEHAGLGRYAGMFQRQDIDLATFLTLSGDDLVKIGVNTFGALRRMQTLIQETNKTRDATGGVPVFSGSAAVGAERRSSSSSIGNY